MGAKKRPAPQKAAASQKVAAESEPSDVQEEEVMEIDPPARAANPMKSSLYFGGVSPQVKALILSVTGYTEGSFPVKYLGIPLFSSRLTQPMFAPLLEKIRQHVSHWATHLLSYAGKIQLINSVIFGLSIFWGSSVLLPIGIVKKINKLCKDFLWGISAGMYKMTFKRWDSFCLPRAEGGVDIKEVLSWNKTQMLSWIHKLVTHTDTIWAKWVEAYILKGRPAGSKARGTMQAHQFLLRPDFKKLFYDMIRPRGPSFLHHKTIWDSSCYPKHKITGMLAVQHRLPTIDNLCSRGVVLVNRCALCESSLESIPHLFFACPFSAVVWQTTALWFKALADVRLSHTLTWFRLHNRGHGLAKKQRRCALLCAIYLLWQERNKRIFNGAKSAPATLIRRIKLLVLLRTV
ncbi:uncharacterized protein LOC141618022 [Silene latifolia]|uniref:uncharacterized protein LOC141618022 n=1 Tax=Silene latifolia TaxID=37657 RepID=UPI003D786374